MGGLEKSLNMTTAYVYFFFNHAGPITLTYEGTNPPLRDLALLASLVID